MINKIDHFIYISFSTGVDMYIIDMYIYGYGYVYMYIFHIHIILAH